ncbi:QWRF motif-containing protein 7 isoform X2 [Euphorbia lathyris]|uniref:QWRF motif-containing protein 7 isoform X2 n=1 Tax=Euphorbia lathyris TaxID=212925 RepID=UPI00331361C2
MGHPITRRPAAPSPPVLVRSRSGSEKDSISSTINTSQRFTTTTTTTRSKSTTKSRSSSQRFSTRISESKDSSGDRESDGFVRFLQRGTSPRNSPATNKMPKSTSTTSPSAWALSPGRSLYNNMFPPEKLPAVSGDRGKVKGVSGVLKFFKQKKVSPVLEDEYHRFRVLHNRLMQWKFVNAKAEATMSSVKTVAEDRLFHVWLRIPNVRSVIVENRIEIQKMKHHMKLCGIIHRQMSLLNNWDKIESKNCEAVSRITRKVSALSLIMPLVDDAKVEKNLYLLTELTTTLQHQDEILGDIEEIITMLAPPFAWERSLRVQLIQLVKE